MTAGASLLPLQIWLSPSFPVGAFAYSHGLEAAVDRGDIGDAESLTNWLEDLIEHGSLRNDCILLASGYHAALSCDRQGLRAANELALALAASRERHLETVSQGSAFLLAAEAAWPCPPIGMLAEMTGVKVAYPVALGTAAAGHGIPLQATLPAFALGFIANLVSAAVRLGPIGQTDGQRIIAGLLPRIAGCAALAMQANIDDLGAAALRADIASMQHETLYSRLFRS